MNFSLSHKNNGNSLSIRRVPVLFMLILLFVGNSLFAKVEPDSLLKSFPEVRVESKRILSTSLAEFSPNSTISKIELQKTGSLQISEALQYIPGLFIKDYGGLGGLKTVSIRGSSANHTLIMINGIKLNSNQNGISDLSNIPLSFVSNVEIIRAGLSAALGSNAMGGAVNIITESFTNDKIEISGGLGSFNENLFALSAAKNYGNLNIKTSFEYKHSDGDYPFEIQHFGNILNVSRANADFSNLSVAISTDYKFQDLTISSFVLFYNAKRGVPGAVLQGHIESPLARMNESGGLLSISGLIPLNEFWLLRSGMNYKMSKMNYNDANDLGIGGKPLDNDFLSDDYNFTIRIFNNSGLEFNIETFHSALVGDMLQPDVSRNPKRSGLALSILTDKNFDFLDFADIVLAGAFRADYFSDNYPVYSPYVGLLVSPNIADFKFKLSASSNFRMPSFNELYFLNYGTANLKPERSLSINFGLNYQTNGLFFEFNGFQTVTNDLIVSIPKSPAMWSAQNVGKADNIGFEFVSSYFSSDSKINADFNYTLQSAKDISTGSLNYGKALVYVPQEIVNINISYNFIWDIVTAVNFNYTSFRYSLQNNDLSSVLPDYYTINIKIMKKINIELYKLNLYFAMDNVSDERYSIVRNFPMQGRIFRAGISLGFGE